MSNLESNPSTTAKPHTPQAIRSFVAQRAATGVPLNLLAQVVGVEYSTVLSWCRKEIITNGDEQLTALELRKRNKKLSATKSELQNLQAKKAAYEARVAAKKLATIQLYTKRIKSELRAKGLTVLVAQRKARLAELKHAASNQTAYRQQQIGILQAEQAAHLEKARGIVEKVRAEHPTAMNMQRIATKLGMSVDDIFAAFKLTNQRFRA